MKREQIPQDLIYSSVEDKIKLSLENEHKQALEVLPLREVICPKCGSKNCWKRGNKERGRKEYSCKECKKFFIFYSLVDEEGKEIKCPDCNSRNYNLSGIRGGETKIYV